MSITSFSSNGIKPIRTHVFSTLNVVWNVAKMAFSLSGDTSDGIPGVKSTPHRRHTPPTNHRNTHSTQITPKRLNTKCAIAARLACTEADKATIFDVIVVPIFSPNTNEIPISIGNTWVEHNVIVIAIMAAEDCTANVKIPPTNR